MKYTLTKRQKQVARLVKKGLTNQEIADRMELKLPTVKFHMQQIFLRLKINSRNKLFLKAI